MKLAPNARVGTFITAGTVTVCFGNNEWAGGDNKIQYMYFVSLPNATATLDGKPVVDNGQLKM